MKIKIFNYTISISKNRKKTKINKIKLTPPSSLDSPTAPEGYRYRWVRVESMGRFPKKGRMRSGYSLVKPTKIQRNKYPVIEKGSYKGFIGVGGLILAQIHENIFKERNEWKK
tara:strand:+ start:1224 stop:1562 length:339 start_codon:yes stop_codon:yes gene_type:complete